MVTWNSASSTIRDKPSTAQTSTDPHTRTRDFQEFPHATIRTLTACSAAAAVLAAAAASGAGAAAGATTTSADAAALAATVTLSWHLSYRV